MGAREWREEEIKKLITEVIIKILTDKLASNFPQDIQFFAKLKERLSRA